MEAAARDLEGFLANGRLECPNNRAMCRQGHANCKQRAGCNRGTAKADGQRAWWKLRGGIWRALRVLRV